MGYGVIVLIVVIRLLKSYMGDFITGKRCKDCKHTRGIGYDFWCGEGHTEYEVFGGETNCPYYEYHDWSKGTPSKTEKRFTLDDFDSDDEMWELLNTQAEIISDLEEENEQLKQFKEDVFNKIDMHLRMLPTARDNEFNEDGGDPSLFTGAIYMLETLKKELEE